VISTNGQIEIARLSVGVELLSMILRLGFWSDHLLATS